MRKVIVVMALVVLSALTLVGCKKNKEEDGKTDTMTEVSDSMEKQDDTVETSTEASVETTAPEGEGGGNEFVNEGESVEIKAPITLEEIESMLEGAEGELVVDITDNNATHKAYDKLVDKLTDLEITFIEE